MYNTQMPGEFDLLEWIRDQHPATDFVPVPQGDDLAVLKWPAADLLLVGVDQVLDGVHFDSAIHSPRQIGAKAMNRNLSDCAAMGCLPAAAVATVALLGRTEGKPVPRAGAKVGDSIFVTGSLGGSILGRHMSFTPRVVLGST